ncbi:MAG: hypothetical protein ACOX2O_02075 [Bdellovibrionota bacterium]|jgi:hypothetical protein
MAEIARGTNGAQTPPQRINGASITGPQTPPQGTNKVFNGDLSTAEITNPTEITFKDFIRGITEDRTRAKEFLESLPDEAIISNLSKLFEDPFDYYNGKTYLDLAKGALNTMEEVRRQGILKDSEIISAIGEGVDICLEEYFLEQLRDISSLLHKNGCGEVAEKIFQDRQETLKEVALTYFKKFNLSAELIDENNLTELETLIQKKLGTEETQYALAEELCILLHKGVLYLAFSKSDEKSFKDMPLYTGFYFEYGKIRFPVNNLFVGIKKFGCDEIAKKLLERDDVKKAFDDCLTNALNEFDFPNAAILLSIAKENDLKDLNKKAQEILRSDAWREKLTKLCISNTPEVNFELLYLTIVSSFLEKQGVPALDFSDNKEFLELYNRSFDRHKLYCTNPENISLMQKLGTASALIDGIKRNNLINDLENNSLMFLMKGYIKDADTILSFIKEHKLGDVEEAKLQKAIGSYLTSCKEEGTDICEICGNREMTDDTAKEIRLFAEKYGVDLKPFHRIINELGFQEQLL